MGGGLRLMGLFISLMVLAGMVYAAVRGIIRRQLKSGFGSTEGREASVGGDAAGSEDC